VYPEDDENDLDKLISMAIDGIRDEAQDSEDEAQDSEDEAQDSEDEAQDSEDEAPDLENEAQRMWQRTKNGKPSLARSC
jgi:hypothetical protein